MGFQAKGVDISRYQGSVNFKKVKEAGYTFVIIRAGYGRLASQKDSKFEEYYKGATEAGLEVGAYWYSYGQSASEGIDEAKACLEVLKGKKFSYPIYFDVEERSQLNLGKSVLTPMVNNFCKTITDAGYVAGLYTFYSAISSFSIDKIDYEKWLAKWSSDMGSCSKDEWCMWQHGIIGNSSEATIDGKVPGFDNCSAVDVDVVYKDYTKVTGISFANGTANKVTETTKKPTVVTESKKDNVSTSTSKTTSIKPGNSFVAKNALLYASATSSSPVGIKNGKMFIYSSEVINGRVRVTNAASNVGKTPVGNYVTGWMKVTDITTTKKTTSSTKKPTKIKTGASFNLNNVKLFSTSSSSSPSSNISGKYWIYDDEVINGRVRVTNAASNVGKTPVGNYVTGWINKSDIK